jgi:hypothetical protein
MTPQRSRQSRLNDDDHTLVIIGAFIALWYLTLLLALVTGIVLLWRNFG